MSYLSLNLSSFYLICWQFLFDYFWLFRLFWFFRISSNQVADVIILLLLFLLDTLCKRNLLRHLVVKLGLYSTVVNDGWLDLLDCSLADALSDSVFSLIVPLMSRHYILLANMKFNLVLQHVCGFHQELPLRGVIVFNHDSLFLERWRAVIVFVFLDFIAQKFLLDDV